MRVVLVNWAKIREGAASGGGVNGYCQALARELRRRGHEVISLCGGTTYEPRPGAREGSYEPGPCSIRRLEDWDGVRVYEVINSPVLAPSIAQFRDPEGEISSPELERVVAGWAAEVQPDVVHFHNIEGFSAGSVAAVRRAAPRARIAYSLHNYHTLCPQVYLMQGHRRPCFDFEGGHACRTCIPTVDPEREKHRAVAKGLGIELEPQWSGWGEPADRERKGLLGRLLGRREAAPAAVATAPAAAPEDRWSKAWIERPARRPLLNVVQPDPLCGRELAAWGRRRAAMVAMLNDCDRVLAVSEFVARKFESMGVDPARIRTLHIGSRMREVADTHRPAQGVGVRRSTLVPVHMAFLGYNNYYKGLPMLAESLELLTPEVLARIHLHVYALQGEQMEPELRALEPRLDGLTLRHGYRYEEIPGLLDGIDLGLVTSVWWDNGPQTVMEFQACGVPVLGAELGGIPDFIRDGENGLLFRGNDRWDLARRIAEVVREPAILDRLRAGVRPPKSMAEHAVEIEQVYTGPLS
jgi:glycosyltransferase involved in cell wall biosynthesis